VKKLIAILAGVSGILGAGSALAATTTPVSIIPFTTADISNVMSQVVQIFTDLYLPIIAFFGTVVFFIFAPRIFRFLKGLAK
jgi:hypothetical protein